ncbi:ATP-binding protein [Streptomyces endophyticus]|uniref:ATP-binding protein n=1 Tax=Streptomyces endophyticus TaxID=714166 RepID=A0ABU6F344_9ACTN|nr:ATP-binding protein [Streptomyces endophyticus]MEB8337903.1 ATP-binding protein [Streptomyces endophyticus]
MSRRSWNLAFTAEPEEVAGLRRAMRAHLELWGLHGVVESAQLCVSELASNIITHVGTGTPATLAVSMNGTYLRIEVQDPDTRVLPTLLAADPDAESGRGKVLVDAVTDRWGVYLRADRKVTWCELATDLKSPSGHGGGPRVTRAEAVLTLSGGLEPPYPVGREGVHVAVAEETAIDLIADLLHWLRAHGCDPDTALDRAQEYFEAEAAEGSGQ